MKICLALSLILPFAHGYSFLSARAANACGIQYNGGSGFGRVSMTTISAKCADEKNMDLECEYLLPHDGGRRTGSWTCPGKEECFDYDRTVLEWPDAGCMEVRSPQGVKGAAKTDGHACSAGIAVGSSSITLSSSISANDHNFDNGLKSCQIVKSGTTNSIYKSSPCSKTTTTIKLAPRTTYQACIDVTSALLTTSVGFTWHLHSHRLKGRGLGDGNGKPLSEMLTVLGNSTANDAFQIVIGNGEV